MKGCLAVQNEDAMLEDRQESSSTHVPKKPNHQQEERTGSRTVPGVLVNLLIQQKNEGVLFRF